MDELKDTIVMPFEARRSVHEIFADQSLNAAKNIVYHLKMGVVTLKISSLCLSGNRSCYGEPNVPNITNFVSIEQLLKRAWRQDQDRPLSMAGSPCIIILMAGKLQTIIIGHKPTYIAPDNPLLCRTREMSLCNKNLH
ncbi:MAG: hypothetical protein GY820_33455 [Gammaproteobacteria bacterium]|nr:hypothetical protein [Gammaproteobacteria bacterium]